MPFLQSLGNLADIVGTRLNLPEFGISERLAGGNTANTGYTRQSQAAGYTRSSPVVPSVINNPRVLSASNTYNPPPSNQQNYGGQQYTPGPINTGGQEQTVNQNAQDLQAQADYEFEQALNVIGQQEGAARQVAGADIQAQQAAGTAATNRAGEAKTKNLRGLEGEQQVAEKQADTGLRGARDLFRQIQQQNIAQLSGLGISSSSVAEALAEKLGVETARRIGGITGNLDEIRQNIAKEKTNVETIFQNKLQEIGDATQAAISGIRANLATQLAQLGQLRGQAAVQKSQARTDIAIRARNAIQQIQLEAQQRAQSVAAAAARRQQALQEAEQFMFKPTDFTGISNAIQNVQGLPQVAGFNIQPQLDYTSVAGQPFVNVTGQYIPSKKEEDDLESPF